MLSAEKQPRDVCLLKQNSSGGTSYQTMESYPKVSEGDTLLASPRVSLSQASNQFQLAVGTIKNLPFHRYERFFLPCIRM